MSLPFSNIQPLDPNIYTAQVRVMAGPVRTGTVTFDVGFTNSLTPPGVQEFARWIYVGTTGNLQYTKWDGTTELLPNMAAGIWHPVYAVNITTANTTIAANQLRWGS